MRWTPSCRSTGNRRQRGSSESRRVGPLGRRVMENGERYELSLGGGPDYQGVALVVLHKSVAGISSRRDARQ